MQRKKILIAQNEYCRRGKEEKFDVCLDNLTACIGVVINDKENTTLLHADVGTDFISFFNDEGKLFNSKTAHITIIYSRDLPSLKNHCVQIASKTFSNISTVPLPVGIGHVVVNHKNEFSFPSNEEDFFVDSPDTNIDHGSFFELREGLAFFGSFFSAVTQEFRPAVLSYDKGWKEGTSFTANTDVGKEIKKNKRFIFF